MNRIARIAGSIAATHDIDVVESVIEGGGFDRGAALESISRIVEKSGNGEAEWLLREITGGVRTAGVVDWIRRIRDVAKGNRRLMCALLAAAVIAGSIDAGAAERVMDEEPSVTIEQVQKQPFELMMEGINRRAMDSIRHACGVKGNYAGQSTRFRMCERFMNEFRKNAHKSPGKTLQKVFDDTIKDNEFKLDWDFCRIMRNSYDSYRMDNGVDKNVAMKLLLGNGSESVARK